MWFVITQLCFVWGSCLIYVYLYICIHFIPLVSKTISMSNEFLMGFVSFNVYFYVVYCYSLFVLFCSAIVLFCTSSILLCYLRTFLSGIKFIPYSLIQTCLSKKSKGDTLNKQYRLLNVTYS